MRIKKSPIANNVSAPLESVIGQSGVETLACHPASTTHSEMSEQDLAQAGIDDSLIRVSVGVEDWRDLLYDILQALDAL